MHGPATPSATWAGSARSRWGGSRRGARAASRSPDPGRATPGTTTARTSPPPPPPAPAPGGGGGGALYPAGGAPTPPPHAAARGAPRSLPVEAAPPVALLEIEGVRARDGGASLPARERETPRFRDVTRLPADPS